MAVLLSTINIIVVIRRLRRPYGAGGVFVELFTATPISRPPNPSPLAAGALERG